MLNLRQPIQPRNHHLRTNFQLGQFLRQRRNDIRQCQTLRDLESVDGTQTARDVGSVEQRRQNLLDGFGSWRGNAVVNSLCGDEFSDDFVFRYLGRILCS